MFLVFLLGGLIIGSFLNVCIYRIPRGLSIVEPARSYCPQCNRQLTWWENIPVLSWLALNGKCRGCKNKISGRYPFVELLSCIAGGASFLHFGATPTAVLVYALTAALIVISFIDLDFKIIPNVISFPGMIIGLCVSIIQQYLHIFAWPITPDALESLIGFIVGGGFFYVIALMYYLRTGNIGLGGGDIKLMGMTGALLGWRSVGPTIMVGSILGAVIGIIVMIIQRTGRKTEIPFGPWLSLGAILYIFLDLPFFRFDTMF